MQYLFHLSGEDVALARAECEAVNPEATGWEERGTMLSCVAGSINTSHLAFTKATYKIVVRGLPAKAGEWLKQHPQRTKKRVRFFRKMFSGEERCSEEAYKVLHAWLGAPPIDLDNPEEIYGIIVSGQEWFVVEQLWENDEDFEARKSHNKPAPHPTGMHPKLARAMINLARPKKEVLDPFCGAGGILLEARLMGLAARGVDIDEGMIVRSEKNLEHFGVKADLIHGDALAYKEKAEVIVTDAPYGMNSKAEELDRLFSSFLAHAATLTDSLVIGLPDLTDNEALISDSPWNVNDRFVRQLHKSLKKEIFVLTKELL